MRRVRYENPLEVVLVASGVTLVFLAWFAGFIRDWPARRRIGNAVARDMEDLVDARTEFRRQLLDLHARGELTLSPDEVMKALGDQPLEAMARLSALDPVIEQSESSGS